MREGFRLAVCSMAAVFCAVALAGCREEPEEEQAWDPPKPPIRVPSRAERSERTGQFEYDPAAEYEAVVKTSVGTFRLAFFPEETPKAVENFLRLAAGGFYEEVIVHRVIADELIQAGDPEGTGSGGPGYLIEGEFTDRPFKVATVGMARRRDDPDSAGSQWFVCLKRRPQLDGKYTAFARVIDGLDVVRKISRVPVEGERAVDPMRRQRPVDPPVILGIEVVKTGEGDGEADAENDAEDSEGEAP